MSSDAQRKGQESQTDRDNNRKIERERQRVGERPSEREQKANTVHVLFNVHFLRFVKFFNAPALPDNGKTMKAPNPHQPVEPGRRYLKWSNVSDSASSAAK